MKNRLVKRLAVGAVALSLVAAACGDDNDSGDSTADTTAATEETTATGDTTATADTTAAAAECTEPTKVKLQLQWFIQAQFAGYFAAQDQGYYSDQCLDVEIVEGGAIVVEGLIE